MRWFQNTWEASSVQLLLMTRSPQQTKALVTCERGALMHVLEGHNGGEHERLRAAPEKVGVILQVSSC